jgi:hypothetical protein
MRKLIFPTLSFITLAVVVLTNVPAARAAEQAPCNRKWCFKDVFTWTCLPWISPGAPETHCDAGTLGISCSEVSC